MCLDCMHFRAPHIALEHNNYHNSPNLQPIIAYFRSLLKFTKLHILATFSQQLNVFCLCYRHVPIFSFLFFNTFPATMYFMLMRNMTKQGESNRTGYNILNQHREITLRESRKRVSIIAKLTLKMILWGCPMHGIFWDNLSEIVELVGRPRLGKVILLINI